jgi:hypothetical protein
LAPPAALVTPAGNDLVAEMSFIIGAMLLYGTCVI